MARQPESRGAKLSVLHRTVFHYGSPASQNVNTLRLEPRTFPYQKTLTAWIRVIPTIRLRRFTDLFQNITHHFELTGPHSSLEIESRIRVHNLPLDISETSKLATTDAFKTGPVRDLIWPFLQETRVVANDPVIWRQAVDIGLPHSSVYDKALAVMRWIHQEFRYEPGTTQVSTLMHEAFAQKSGVCQDFTHVMLGMCRAIGIPARYASGYLYNGPRDSLVGAQASHAWAEIYLPAAGWIGFDPTNNTLADERYVKVAVGRDYNDVPPIQGNYHGSGHCRMEVTVEVEKIPF